MYVPSYESLLRSLGTTKTNVESSGRVTIPAPLFKMLLQMAIGSGDFDEEVYLRANPDVREAVRRKEIESGLMHYLGFGYFEGRKGGTPEVDERWYLRKYPDVASAVKDGAVSSAAEHFNAIGAGEGRSPNADQEPNAAQWKKALGGNMA